MIVSRRAYDPVKGCDNMEQWEDAIEQYKRELMRYAKENGRLYAETSEQPPAPPEPAQQAEPVWKQYKKNRPMPPEYAGEETEKEAEPKEEAAPPDPPETDELTEGREAEYASFEEFAKANPARGLLRIQAFAARQAFPVVNAKIEVEKDFADGTHSFAEAYTDINGVVENIALPTKDKSLSQSPGGVIPYATYTVRVTHPHFAPTEFCRVPIFDGIESLQPVAMVQAGQKTVTVE